MENNEIRLFEILLELISKAVLRPMNEGESNLINQHYTEAKLLLDGIKEK